MVGLFFLWCFLFVCFFAFLNNKREDVCIVGNYFTHLGGMKRKKAELLRVKANFQERTGVPLKFT